VRCYGDRALDVLDIAQRQDLTGSLVSGLAPIEAEALYCAQAEMATHLSDVLSRRTRLALIDPAAGIGPGARSLDVMGSHFSWSRRERKRQADAHRGEIENERGLPLHAARKPRSGRRFFVGAG
jgi:glycerol-3-phosphate dehydrogenase